MATMSVRLRSIANTQAAVGWAEGHTIVVDRPHGKADGIGLGFNGGQLLGLAIGGCFCNDLHYVAHDMGVRLTSIAVDASVDFEGNPLIANNATVHVAVTAADAGADIASIIRRAEEVSAVSNSIKRGIPVSFVATS